MEAIIFIIVISENWKKEILKDASFTYPLVLFISSKDVFLFSFISKPFKLYWNITSAL